MRIICIMWTVTSATEELFSDYGSGIYSYDNKINKVNGGGDGDGII